MLDMAQALPLPNADQRKERLLPKVPRSHVEDRNSPLHVACHRGAYNEALMLLLSGHNTSIRNIWLATPLHQCTAQGHLDVMMLLLDGGANVNLTDHQNLTPLHQAIIHGNKDATELLLCYGSSLHNAVGVTDTRSPLELADHVHVCHKVISKALGRVWPLQHLCRIAIRKFLGVSRRRRIKELPLPKAVISNLCTLPVAKSNELHQNWERVKTGKAEAVRKKGEARRAKRTPYIAGIHLLRNQ